jgi:2,3-dihydroxybenzoate-AMP ligase
MIPHTSNEYDLWLAKKYSRKRWWLGMTIGDVLDKNADLYPDKEALVAENSRYTFSELRKKADQIAYGLIGCGLTKGDRVMLQLPNWSEFILAHYAIQKAGMVMVLLTVNHTAREISHLAELTQPAAWITITRYRDTDYTPLINDVVRKVKTIKKVITIGADTPSGCMDFLDLDKNEIDSEQIRKVLDEARPDPGDVCYLLPTGGTTNLPKCAVRTHNDYLCNVEYKSRAWDINTTDICLVATTVGHNLALLVTFLGPHFHGAKIVLLDSTHPEDFFRIAAREKVTCTGLVPTLISRFVAYKDISSHDLSALTRIYVGAANSPPELVRRVETSFGCRYVTAFGMVEGPCSQTRPYHSLKSRCETIGKPVCPYDDFCTLNEKGEKTLPGVEGELAAKGPGVFPGYYRNPQINQFAFTPDGYFRTGDLAVIDEKGYIRITGRIKDVINRGGEKISARDVEDAISTHPKVEYVAAVGIPDSDLGEKVCAFIKPVQGDTLQIEDIVEQMKTMGVSKALIPACLEVVDHLPLTAAGKVDKKVLRQMTEKKYSSIG